MAHLCEPFFDLSLLGQYPAAPKISIRIHEREALLLRELKSLFRRILRLLTISEELVKEGCTGQSPHEAKGVSKFPSQGDGLGGSFAGLLWIPKKPEYPSCVGKAPYPRVLPI